MTLQKIYPVVTIQFKIIIKIIDCLTIKYIKYILNSYFCKFYMNKFKRDLDLA